MKKVFAIVMSVVLLLTLVPGVALADKPAVKGNGAPNGQHETINIIGLPKGELYSKDLNDNFKGGNGSRIFVSRQGTTTFYVHGGSGFQICDHDGTDGSVGENKGTPGLIFPYDAGKSPTWRVEIWVRMLGPVDAENKTNWITKYWDGDKYALFSSFELKKDAPGGTKFVQKTGQLLADGYEDMLWEMTPGTKFRHLQMRIFLLD